MNILKYIQIHVHTCGIWFGYSGVGRYTSGIWFGYSWVGGCVFVCNENIITYVFPHIPHQMILSLQNEGCKQWLLNHFRTNFEIVYHLKNGIKWYGQPHDIQPSEIDIKQVQDIPCWSLCTKGKSFNLFDW